MPSEYGPEFDEFVDRARKELVPKIEGSDAFVSITPLGIEEGKVDIKFALELGLAILYDKPIIVCTPPGRKIPAKLIKVGDRFVEYDLNDENSKVRLTNTIKEVLGVDDDEEIRHESR